LTWENGQGLTFTRQISINDDYLFTFEDSVTSTLASDIKLYPYGLVRRHGTPATTGMYILHEGPLGVFDETLKE
jgi:YidC/Oxa1 family membrane protein insertase